MAERVLRLPRIDGPANEPPYVLVHVSSTKKSEPLDLKLIGTENSSVYVVTVKHTQTSTLKSKTFKGSQKEWDQILGHVLLGTPADPNLLEGIEAVAAANSSKLKINIRKRIEGITQRLGAIELLQDDSAEDDFNGFEWCALALESTNSSSHELESLSVKVREQEESIQKLEAKFGDLVKSKKEHENELIQKFSALLNEKKLKIRDQQRLLASAKVDSTTLTAVEATRQTESRIAESSRTRKRKAGGNSKVAPEEDEESDDEFEKMDVDVDQLAGDSDREQAMTPDPESETETEDEPEEDPQPVVPTTEAKPVHSIDEDKPPPPRALPFGRKAAIPNPPPAPKPSIDAGSETESDDDEL